MLVHSETWVAMSVSQVASRFLSFILNMLVARRLTHEQFGVIEFLLVSFCLDPKLIRMCMCKVFNINTLLYSLWGFDCLVIPATSCAIPPLHNNNPLHQSGRVSKGLHTKRPKVSFSHMRPPFSSVECLSVVNESSSYYKKHDMRHFVIHFLTSPASDAASMTPFLFESSVISGGFVTYLQSEFVWKN